ncbi:DUF6636 domain-containing protein [Neisseria bergeri]|uniref:DUF6636 domain-containing protein n=1 Tax=Neisseria bergeri TaxID=1906581 RepID=UPI000E58D098|nr:DUF6636 domain-containing protein [Neisseria bergeri]
MLRKTFLILSATLAFAHAHADAPDGIFAVNFQSPSGNIVCGGDTGPPEGEEPWYGVSCFIRETDNTKPAMPKPKGCGFDWGNVFNIDNKGKAYMSCYSDYPYSPEPPVLAYGHTAKGKGWQCGSLENGVLCTNSAGHGFLLNRKWQRMF